MSALALVAVFSTQRGRPAVDWHVREEKESRNVKGSIVELQIVSPVLDALRSRWRLSDWEKEQSIFNTCKYIVRATLRLWGLLVWEERLVVS
jgi:hypothetical protein